MIRTFQLINDHSGFKKDDKFEGPFDIPDAKVEVAGTPPVTHIHTHNDQGYYLIGADRNSNFCFFKSYVESNPLLFKEITQ